MIKIATTEDAAYNKVCDAAERLRDAAEESEPLEEEQQDTNHDTPASGAPEPAFVNPVAPPTGDLDPAEDDEPCSVFEYLFLKGKKK